MRYYVRFSQIGSHIMCNGLETEVHDITKPVHFLLSTKWCHIYVHPHYACYTKSPCAPTVIRHSIGEVTLPVAL